MAITKENKESEEDSEKNKGNEENKDKKDKEYKKDKKENGENKEKSKGEELTKEIAEEKIAKLEEELKKKNEELLDYVSHAQRLQADFENFKKQSEKQKQDVVKFANEALITNLLDSYEDLERALKSSNTKEELQEGVELIYSKLKNTLEKEGLCEISTEGEKFDPFKHEALMAENSPDHENGEIIDELMKGYTLKDKVIKYSKVRVCKK
ncbi:MAG: nucleotide exchange factor GrpE [Methanobrevibacter sp.]|jgi:molecular chaperone GrpE|nr:nucleotide exchange factor GrpE [Methanobrevibacter sp.]